VASDHSSGEDVDIDPQAVEITMMSLYIKALEGETALPHKHGLLPTLASNIKCGNSLIGPDYFEGQLVPDAEEWERVSHLIGASSRPPPLILPRAAGKGWIESVNPRWRLRWACASCQSFPRG
jgi:hypothetical protein